MGVRCTGRFSAGDELEIAPTPIALLLDCNRRKATGSLRRPPASRVCAGALGFLTLVSAQAPSQRGRQR